MRNFNIDLLKFGTHGKTNDYIDGLFSHGYLLVILKPTRISNSSATLVDHIYSNNTRIHSIHSGIILTGVADHFGIFHLLTEQSTNTHIRISSSLRTSLRTKSKLLKKKL